MNKKEKNRKLVKQNKRNRIVNRRYTSTIKTLSKLFLAKSQIIVTETDSDKKANFKTEILNILNKIYSIVDKGVKKGVIHKNTAARKKSRIGKIFTKI